MRSFNVPRQLTLLAYRSSPTPSLRPPQPGCPRNPGYPPIPPSVQPHSVATGGTEGQKGRAPHVYQTAYREQFDAWRMTCRVGAAPPAQGRPGRHNLGEGQPGPFWRRCLEGKPTGRRPVSYPEMALFTPVRNCPRFRSQEQRHIPTSRSTGRVTISCHRVRDVAIGDLLSQPW